MPLRRRDESGSRTMDTLPAAPPGSSPRFESPEGISRRAFLQAGGIAGGGAALAAISPLGMRDAAARDAPADAAAFVDDIEPAIANASIARLQRLMGAGQLSSGELVDLYLRRIQAIDEGLEL